MPPPFRKVSIERFRAMLEAYPLTRHINGVHMHHTGQPTHAGWAGESSLLGVWRLHTAKNGWRDIAQHLTIDPEGGLWLGRDWNTPPASASGHNGSMAAGPFMFAIVGNFDEGADAFAGPQRDAALQIICLIQDRFALPSGSLQFHNRMAANPCPGSAISYDEVLEAVEALRAETRPAEARPPGLEGLELETAASLPEGVDFAAGPEVLFGEDGDEEAEADDAHSEPGTMDDVILGEDDEPPLVPSSSPPGADSSELTDSQLLTELLIKEMLPAGGLAAYSQTLPEEMTAEPVESAGARAERDAGFGEEGLFDGGLPADYREKLRLHVINLRRGAFSDSGRFRTRPEDVDAIFAEIESRVKVRSAADPLRLVIWAHGGLVNEVTGLRTAYKHVAWWNANNVYPLYFVWETGLFEVLARLLVGEVGGEESAFSERFTEVSDTGVERVAWFIKGRNIWRDMQVNARLSSSQGGGAAYAAERLVALAKRYPGRMQVHAVGHSAGSIFHASFIEEALKIAAREGAPLAFRSLLLLAPAIRCNLFKQRTLPLIGADRGIQSTALFTMRDKVERDDNCVKLYRKSLLYLVRACLEDRQNEPILGMQKDNQADPVLRDLFAGVSGPGEVIWSTTDSSALPQNQSLCSTHGGFDDDPSTLDSLLRRVLGSDGVQRYPREGVDTAPRVPSGRDEFTPGEEGRAEGSESRPSPRGRRNV